MPRLYGYAKIGKKCYDTKNWRERGRINVIGALFSNNNTLITQSLFRCSIDSDIFYAWTIQDLLPSLNRLRTKCAIVMDNATFHKREDIRSAINRAGHILVYQPAYSPDLNPIEKKWSQAKAIRRKYHCSVEDIFRLHLRYHFITT